MVTTSAPNDLIAAVGGLQPEPFPLINWRTDVRHEPKQERSIATRKLILDAARSLANENGINGVTMQLVSQRAGIASGTAYQFFDDLECIYRDIYEEWYRDWWSSVVLSTSRPWTAATWADELDAVVEAGCKFHLKQKEMWEVIRYVESTKVGREGMKLLFDANVERCIQWVSPYLKSVGMTAAEIRFLAISILRTARGHHMYWPIESTSLREVIRGSQEAQRAIVEMKLRTVGKKGGASSAATRAKSV
jgi:AcrR family transcriptional regulator